MKKNILIAVLVLTNLFSLAYAFVQRAEAMRQAKSAMENMVIAEKNMQQAIEMSKMAQEANEAKSVLLHKESQQK
jgi:hypothetical protein